MFPARIILTFAFVLHHHIRFSSADDGLFTDEISQMFNTDDLDPFQGTTSISYLSDPTISGSDLNLDSSDLFTSDVDFNSDSTIDLTSFDIADCGGPSTSNGVFRKKKQRKARIRRDTLCGTSNPSSPLPSLSLPSLPSFYEAGTEDDDPLRPATAEERKQADKINVLLLLGEQYIHSGPQKDCDFTQHLICSSGDRNDMQLEETGYTYTVMRGKEGKGCPTLPSLSRHARRLFFFKKEKEKKRTEY